MTLVETFLQGYYRWLRWRYLSSLKHVVAAVAEVVAKAQAATEVQAAARAGIAGQKEGLGFVRRTANALIRTGAEAFPPERTPKLDNHGIWIFAFRFLPR